MKLLVLDGNSILNRAFYGIRLLSNKDGLYTNAVYGFLNILHKLQTEQAPDGVCVCFDLKAPTFRHRRYEGYKAQRKPMPEELAVQLPLIRQVLDALNIPRLELEGYEADDLIGTIARICEEKGWETAIATGDKDSLQLVTEKTHVLLVSSRMGQTTTKEMSPESFREEYGFAPEKIVDLKALMGDTSDNIPGVAGVGEKTAMGLLQTYGSLEAIYQDLSALDVKDGVRKKLDAGRESAQLSYELATICRQAPMDFDPETARNKAPDNDSLYRLFQQLEFNKLMERYGLTAPEAELERQAAESLPVVDIQTPEALEELSARIKMAERVALWLTDGLDALELCDGEKVYALQWSTAGAGYNAFLRLLFSDQVKKCGHDVKDLMRLALEEGLSAEGFVFDTALAAYVLDPTESGYELSKLSKRWLGGEEYPAAEIFRLQPILEAELEKNGQTALYQNIELPLCAVLAEMEQVGVRVDKKALEDFGAWLQGNIDRLQQTIYDLAGQEFNINSPKQLGEVLFDKLMLPVPKKTKTGYSTNAEVLEKLRGKHPIIENIMDFRQYTKLKSTYADGLVKVIGPDGRIHSNFKMTVTATGRLSSAEPNLQNIPVRRELGSELRKMFVAAEGMQLVDADYSQIELRLLAHISGDQVMQQAFISGEDVHAVTASQVFGVPLGEVTSLQRSRAKAVNFGIVYGISAFSLAQDIGVFQNEAKAYMDSYLEKYSGVRAYMKEIVAQARQDGFVSTLYGRRRPLPELKSSNYNLRSFGERVALNMPIQGTAADIIKLAMVHVHRRLKAEGLRARLILQVHDELIVEAPMEEADSVAAILTEEMERCALLSVPLTAEAHWGKTWFDAK